MNVSKEEIREAVAAKILLEKGVTVDPGTVFITGPPTPYDEGGWFVDIDGPGADLCGLWYIDGPPEYWILIGNGEDLCLTTRNIPVAATSRSAS